MQRCRHLLTAIFYFYLLLAPQCTLKLFGNILAMKCSLVKEDKHHVFLYMYRRTTAFIWQAFTKKARNANCLSCVACHNYFESY